MAKVAASVVWCNPDPDVLDNINTYLNQVERLYISDNSEPSLDESILKEINKLKNVEYLGHKSNLGISPALNKAAKRAIEDGFEYLITMDEDGIGTPGMVNGLLEIIQSSPDIGLVAAEHVNLKFQKMPAEKITREVYYTMTNGNIMSLAAYQKVGEFLEELVIDHLDHEYCLRLKKHGYKVLKTTNAIVLHTLGKASRKKLLFFHLYPTNHSPGRLYYRTRNRFYVDKMYKKIFPEYVREDRKNMLREMIEILLYDDDLWKKIKMMLRGYSDYRKNRMGRFFNKPGSKF
jgi:rhamnosyltransferase